MEIERNKIIKEIFDSIHREWVPCFHWQFHPDMRYWYNENINCIECDCGLSLPVILKVDEINERNIRKLIDKMEDQIYRDYKKMGWDLGYRGD